MAFCIKDETTDKLVRKLAKRKGKTLTETVREAAQNELAKLQDEVPVSKKLEALAKEFAKLPKSGKKADKAFFDWLSGEEDVR